MDEAIEIGSRLFYSHDMRPARAGAAFSYLLSGFQVGTVSVGRLAYGCEVDLEMGGLHESYGISAPRASRLNLGVGSKELTATPDFAVLVGPVGEATASGWEASDDELTLIRFDRRTLEAELGRMINAEVSSPIDFGYVLDLRTGRGADWWRMVLALYDSAGTHDGLTSSPILAAQFASVLMSGLLLATEHSYRPALDRDGRRVVPAAIRRAVDFIDENAHTPITIPDVAAAIGASVRTLQRGFSEHLDTTPLTYLARVRLERAHHELVAGTPETTSVTSVASRWGYFNPGRFAARYRAAYGAFPSDTLRRT